MNPRIVTSAVAALLVAAAAALPGDLLTRAHSQASPALAVLLVEGAVTLRWALAGLGLYLGVLAFFAPRFASLAVPARDREEGGHIETAVFVVIVLVAIATRLYKIGQGLWYDEVLTYAYYAAEPLGEMLSTYNSQNQHFLYSLAWKSLLPYFDAATALRLPAAAFGVASIVAVYLLGAASIGRRYALAACALMTLSYHHVWFSQNARGYSALMFFTILSSLFLLRGLRHGRTSSWVGYAVSVALGAYTQPLMVVISIGQFLSVAIRSVVAGRQWAATVAHAILFGFGLAAVLTITAYAAVLPQLLDTTGAHGGSTDQWSNPLWALLELTRGLQVGGLGAVVMAAGVTVLCAGSASLLRREPIVVETFLFPVLLVLAITLATTHNVWPRLFLFSMGHVLLVAVAGTMALGTFAAKLVRVPQSWGRAAGWAGIAVVCAAFVVALPRAYKPKQDFVGAMEYVNAHREPGDVVITIALTVRPYRDFFATDWKPAPNFERFRALRAGARTTWAVYFFPDHVESRQPEIMAELKRDFVIAERFDATLGGGTIYVARSKHGSDDDGAEEQG